MIRRALLWAGILIGGAVLGACLLLGALQLALIIITIGIN